MSIEAEWIEWKGSCERPLNVDCLVDVCTKTYNLYRTTSDCVDWMSVISYRIHNAFEVAPDEATHLLRWNGQADIRAFVTLRDGEYYDPEDALRCRGATYNVGPGAWQVIATRKRPQPKVISQESYFDKGMIYTKSHVTYDDGESCRQSEPVTANKTVQAALKHIQDRAATYDKPTGERSMSATVEAFNAIAGTDLTEEQGWMFMALLKIVRSQQGEFKADNYEDLAAYAGLMAEAGATARPVEQERNK